MAVANKEPIYTLSGDVSSNGTTGMATGMVTATGDYTGVSANHVLVFTADATNGGYIRRLRFQATGACTASVARIYLNNDSSNGTATNNTFYGQVSLPGIVATIVAATSEVDYPMEFALNPGFRIYTGLGTTVATSWVCTAIGGKY
jgi:hypothetical protein